MWLERKKFYDARKAIICHEVEAVNKELEEKRAVEEAQQAAGEKAASSVNQQPNKRAGKKK